MSEGTRLAPRRLTRRGFLGGVAGVSVSALGLGALQSCATPRASPLPRIGYLGNDSGPSGNPYVGAFRQGLREQGWVEGQSIVVEYRFAQGRLERLPNFAAELVRLRVEAIVASRDQAAHAAKAVTPSIPIVMADASDPVGAGLVADMVRPGGNVTGLTLMSPELSVKRLELLRELVPGLRRVAVLWNPTSVDKQREVREAEAAARALDLELEAHEARVVTDFAPALRAAASRGAQGLLVLRDPLTFLNQELLAFLASENRLAAVSEPREFAEAGGLAAYGPSVLMLYRRAATYVRKLLEGRKASELPVERPTRFELVVNARVARALGLSLPRSVLTLADEVIS